MPVKGNSKYRKGSVFISSKYGQYEVLEYLHGKKILIRFQETGYEYWTSCSRIIRDEVKDKLACRIFGVGIIDVDYSVEYTKDGKRIVCPYYRTWKNMLQRCYHNPSGSYVGCSVDTRWHRLSVFKVWMEEQDWQGKQLDKDLLVPGNKGYGPDTCVFISSVLNVFITKNTSKTEGLLPKGYRKRGETRYIAQGSKGYIGSFKTAEEAHEAWKADKRKAAQELLDREGINDQRIVDALMNRYA